MKHTKKSGKRLFLALLLLITAIPAGGCTQDTSLYGDAEWFCGGSSLVTAKDGSGPYLFHVFYNVVNPSADLTPERFYLWDEDRHALVPLDVYYDPKVQPLQSDPNVMDALREQLVTAYCETADSNGSVGPARSFLVTQGDNVGASDLETLAQKYYQEDYLAFEAIFPLLEEETQREWLEYAYREEEKALFSGILDELNPDQDELIQWAQRAYADDKVAISDALARQYLDADALPAWLSQAQEGGRTVFQRLLENAIQDRKRYGT